MTNKTYTITEETMDAVKKALEFYSDIEIGLSFTKPCQFVGKTAEDGGNLARETLTILSTIQPDAPVQEDLGEVIKYIKDAIKTDTVAVLVTRSAIETLIQAALRAKIEAPADALDVLDTIDPSWADDGSDPADDEAV